MRMKTLLLTISLVLTLTTLAANAAGQVVAQPYRVSDKEVAKLLDRIKEGNRHVSQEPKKRAQQEPP